MSRLRFTLAQLMALVILVGFGFAALRNANEFWASATYTLAFVLVSIAPLGALARNGTARMVWAGFGAFGWARLLVGALPHPDFTLFGAMPSPGLLTDRAFDYLLQYLSTPGVIDNTPAQVCHSLEIILFGLVGTVLGRLMAPTDERQSA
jgi:hypothetical protein